MSEAFLGELRLFPYNFAPRAWMYCDGQILSIAQNTALFSLLGTTYGGNGQTTFALPNLQGRAPLHFGQGPGLSNYVQGQAAGTGTVTLLQTQIPAHIHQVQARDARATLVNGAIPANTKALAQAVTATNPVQEVNLYGPGATTVMKSTAVSAVGGQPHENRQPYLALGWCICVEGLFPSRN